MVRCIAVLALCIVYLNIPSIVDTAEVNAAEPTRDEALTALRRATTFFRENCSAGSGYVFRLSEDLSLREGENQVGLTTAWIEPPATPAVGLAYLEAYQLTGEPSLLDAARDTSGALLQGQLLSGGWTEQIEFDPNDRQNYAYRVEGSDVAGKRNATTFDDDKTQSVIRFLMRLDIELKQSDQQLHEAVEYALAGVLEAQYANGAWPQKYEGQSADDRPVGYSVADFRASYPETWSREFPNEKYSNFYTLNDGTLCDLISTLLEAGASYDDQGYTDAAMRGGEFLLRAQMPEPQPGWAQQYDTKMQPAWARKFEPPSISGGESQGVMRLLLTLYEATGDRRYFEAVQRGLDYYQRCVLPSGRLARFYELHTNQPLYFTMTYELTYSDSDLPTHYAFTVTSGLERLARDLEKLRERTTDQRPKVLESQTRDKPKLTGELRQAAEQVVSDLDARGAWVEQGTMRTHKDANVKRVVSSATFIKNLRTLAQFVAATIP